jgi:hypothetical protein
MAQRERLTVAEVAREVARIVDAAGNRAVLPDQTTYQAVRKQVATDIVVGFFDNRGKVTLMMASTPLELLPHEYFEKALAPYPGGAADPEFLSAYVAPEKASEVSWDPGACITREGWAAWLRKQQYPWPKCLGVEPAIEAVGAFPGPVSTPREVTSAAPSASEGQADGPEREGSTKTEEEGGDSVAEVFERKKGPGKSPRAYYEPFRKWLLLQFTCGRLRLDVKIAPNLPVITAAWKAYCESTHVSEAARELPKERRLREIIARIRDEALNCP